MKREKTYYFQKLAPLNTSVAASLDAVSESGQPPGRTVDGVFPDGAQDRYAILPAELVTLHPLDLPVRSARQRRDAVPFALEEAVGRPLDHLHFAICDTFADGRFLVAVVDKSVMERTILAAPDRPIIAEQMGLPPPAPDPSGQTTWRSYRDGDRILVRASDGTGFAASADMLPMMWSAAGKPVIEAYGDTLPDDVTRHERPAASLPLLQDLDRHDMRQGAYRPSRGLGRPARWLAASTVLAVCIHFGLAAADVRAQRDIADSLHVAATTALDQRLPSASADDSPSLLIRQIALLSSVQRGSNFLPTMNQISRAWLRDGANVQLHQLIWADDVLRLVVETPDLDALQSAEASLSAGGLQVSSGAATADQGSARAELTVRP